MAFVPEFAYTHVWTSKCDKRNIWIAIVAPILFALLPTGNDWASPFPPTQMKVGRKMGKLYREKMENSPVDDKKERPNF